MKETLKPGEPARGTIQTLTLKDRSNPIEAEIFAVGDDSYAVIRPPNTEKFVTISVRKI